MKRTKLSVSLILIVINVLVFLLPFLLFFSGPLGNSFDNFLALGWKENQAIENGEYYRLLTAIFLHGGMLHLFFNMYSLYAIGPFVERFFGSLTFLSIYLSAGVAGSIASFVFSPYVPSVGASGAIFGLAGALLAISMRSKNMKLFQNIFLIILINLFIGLSVPNIDNWGHIGGLVFGFLISWIFIKLDN